MQAIKEWKRYMAGKLPMEVNILTDHRNLLTFTTTKQLNGRQVRWMETLVEQPFIIRYQPGKEKGKADTLTRRSDDWPDEEDEKKTQYHRTLLDQSKFLSEEYTRMIEEQQEEEKTEINRITMERNLIQRIQDKSQNDERIQKIKKALKEEAKELKEEALGLCKWTEGTMKYEDKLWIPEDETLQTEIIRNNHDNIEEGHGGSAKTLNLISRTYYWPEMRQQVKQYVKNCDNCQRIKSNNHAPYGLLKPLEATSRPWKSIAMDFITQLPESGGNDTIWVVIDRLTKMAHFIPCRTDMTAGQCIRLFTENVFRLHGMPKDIRRDRGSIFTSDKWKEITQEWDIKSNLSTAFHPEMDGQMERTNDILEQYLRAYVNYQQDDWTELLPFAEFAYNNSRQETIGRSPFYANYGYNPVYESTGHMILEKSVQPEQMSQLHKVLKTEITEAQMSQNEYADRHRKPDPNWKQGDKVWLIPRNIRTTRPAKNLDYKKLGPFRILAKIGMQAYKLDLPDSMKVHPTFHVSLLETYQDNPLPSQVKPPPPPIEIDGNEEYELEEILDSRH